MAFLLRHQSLHHPEAAQRSDIKNGDYDAQSASSRVLERLLPLIHNLGRVHEFSIKDMVNYMLFTYA